MKILYKHPRSGCIAWPDNFCKNYNGSNTPCDMLVGPCCCGATHYPEEFESVLKAFDFEIKDFPANASRELRIEVCGATSVLHEQAAANFKEYLKLVSLPKPPSTHLTATFDFLYSIEGAILGAAKEGRRFCRLGIPKRFDQMTVLTEWLAASGYQTDFNELELTISW